MNTINEIQDQVVEEFEMFEEWMDKYEYIIELGKELAPLAEKHKVKQNLIEGCQSRVWLYADLNTDSRIIFSADSDAIITKGVVGMLAKILSNHTPQEILNADLYFIEKIGLSKNLSPTRSNGLVSMIKQMKMYALAYQTKLSSNQKK